MENLSSFRTASGKGVLIPPIDHFTVACLVACPLNESEA